MPKTRDIMKPITINVSPTAKIEVGESNAIGVRRAYYASAYAMGVDGEWINVHYVMKTTFHAAWTYAGNVTRQYVGTETVTQSA